MRSIGLRSRRVVSTLSYRMAVSSLFIFVELFLILALVGWVVWMIRR